MSNTPGGVLRNPNSKMTTRSVAYSIKMTDRIALIRRHFDPVIQVTYTSKIMGSGSRSSLIAGKGKLVLLEK